MSDFAHLGQTSSETLEGAATAAEQLARAGQFGRDFEIVVAAAEIRREAERLLAQPPEGSLTAAEAIDLLCAGSDDGDTH